MSPLTPAGPVGPDNAGGAGQAFLGWPAVPAQSVDTRTVEGRRRRARGSVPNTAAS